MTDQEWWRGAALYQIYLRSFQDGNGDGIGDLAGAVDRLEYVASLGVDGVWLTPFFASPMRDFGYDVSDHCSVDPVHGSLDDFDRLVARAHELGLKVIIDQVWNHTALEHPWFAESRSSRDNRRADWYVWADAKADGSPPNNWLSWMGGPAWTWEPRRRQYYLHNFLSQMPDLNFHCPEVQDAVLQAARFWLDRGVDGFRLDAANFYFHHAALTDNPALPATEAGDLPVLMQRHEYNANQPQTPGFLERVRATLDEYESRMSVAEIGGADGLARMLEYTRGPRRLHTAYSFALLGDRQGPQFVASCLEPWQSAAARDAWPCWAMSNHDVPRSATRWRGTPRLHLALLVALRGTLFIYQGEELGLTQGEVAFEDLQDPFGKAHWPLDKGRDGCRTPMPWQEDAVHTGFTCGVPWLPVDPAHRALAVDAQQSNPRSVLQWTRRLLALRQQRPALRVGSLDVEHVDDALLILRRRHGEETLWLAFNLGAGARTFAAPRAAGPTLISLEQARVHEGRVELPAHSAIFLQLNP